MLVLFVIFSGLLSLILVRKHYLLCLLSLEILVISVFMFSMLYFSFFGYDLYFIIVFLVLGVCDGVLGLSVLVYLVRSAGKDYLDNLVLC